MNVEILKAIKFHIEAKKYEFNSNGYKVEFIEKKRLFEGLLKGKMIFKKTF